MTRLFHMPHTLARVTFLGLLLAAGSAISADEWRPSTSTEAALDAKSFAGVTQTITDHLTDVQSVVVVVQGRLAYEFYRDGNPQRLRDQQSVAKSALSTLVGIALQQGHIASIEEPVVKLLPEWSALNPDPRAARITIRHLLTMTAGFEVKDPLGIAASGTPQNAWSRTLVTDPGTKFAYDNALVPVLTAVLEKATGMPLANYARAHLVGPLGFAEPSYSRGLQLRTIDMAKLGQLVLQEGKWGGNQVVPQAFAKASAQPQSKGGPPGAMPYGYMWWILPPAGDDHTFMASGYAGQVIWVEEPKGIVMAITSTVSEQSQARGQFLQLIRAKLIPASLERRSRTER
jgi:CubicO group peptidase (beta-lactamase class C family)